LAPVSPDRKFEQQGDRYDGPVVRIAWGDAVKDQDFFGSGIATWMTDRVELYLRQR
jgi:hypothetical protein